ncbi:hypothetical protein KC901_01840, partial [Patescibacteria group bacterium]|nr:hypothetical protein [Patescibacteria group bacterium]
NVIGWIFYSLIFGQGTSNGDFSSYVMVIGIAIPIFAAFGALIFLKEPISVQKSIGLIFGVISVYLLTK